jgi:hypothetical protein
MCGQIISTSFLAKNGKECGKTATQEGYRAAVVPKR